MADFTKGIKNYALNFSEYQPVFWEAKKVSLADLTGGGTVDNLFDLAAETAVVDAIIIPRVTATSGGAPTLELSVNGEVLISAIALADLAKGKVKRADTTASLATYVSAADTVDVTVAASTYTAGEVEILIGYVTIQDNT